VQRLQLPPILLASIALRIHIPKSQVLRLRLVSVTRDIRAWTEELALLVNPANTRQPPAQWAVLSAQQESTAPSQAPLPTAHVARAQSTRSVPQGAPIKHLVFAIRGIQGISKVRPGALHARQDITKIVLAMRSAEAVLLENSPLSLAQPQACSANHVLNFLCRVTALRLSRTASARPDILVPVLHARFVPRAISAMVMELKKHVR